MVNFKIGEWKKKRSYVQLVTSVGQNENLVKTSLKRYCNEVIRYVVPTVADPGFLNRGVADLTEQYRNNQRQSVIRDSFVHFLNFKLKGPLQYLLRPLLSKNEFAVTQHMYAFIGPNLDNIHWGQMWFSLWRHRTTPTVTWSETEKCVFT